MSSSFSAKGQRCSSSSWGNSVGAESECLRFAGPLVDDSLRFLESSSVLLFCVEGSELDLAVSSSFLLPLLRLLFFFFLLALALDELEVDELDEEEEDFFDDASLGFEGSSPGCPALLFPRLYDGGR